MSTGPDSRFCACCEASSPRAPAEVWNRPGLSAIGYRIGTFATFRQAMLEGIASEPELSALATRESDDYAITLLELAAVLGDVLTFYNERIANELFLRTARERDSLLRLARLIGYRLRPGLAATAMLAFTLDDGATTRIRRYLKVMSVPGQDEQPQTFETLEEIVADARLNALPVFAPPLPFNAFHLGRNAAPVITRPEPLSLGDSIVFFGLSRIEEKTVEALERRADGERMHFAPAVQGQGWWSNVTRAARLRRRLRFFGYNAPSSYSTYDADPAIPPANRWRIVREDDPGYRMHFIASETVYPLDARYEDLKPGAQLLVDAGPDADPRLRTATVVATEDAPAVFGPLQDAVTHVRLRQSIRGRPAPIVRPGKGTLVLARSGTGAVLSLDPDEATPRWVAWRGIVAADDVSAVAPSSAEIRIFARDAQGKLRRAHWVTGVWHGWDQLGVTVASAPSTILVAGNVLVFARGVDGQLVALEGGGTLLPAVPPLERGFVGAPTAIAPTGARADVFVRGFDRALWRISWNGISWSDWESLQGVLASPPAAAAAAAGRLDVVALDPDGALVHRRWTGTAWTDWRNLGGKAQGEPAIVAIGLDRVDIFVRGDDDQLWQIVRTGGSFGPWVALGGGLASSPSAIVSGAQVHVFARGLDNALIARSWNGTSWGAWSSLGNGLGVIPDRRKTRIYELATPDVTFRAYNYPAALSGGRVAAPRALAPGLEGLDKGRRILLDDGTTKHLARITASQMVATEPGNEPDHLLIDFDPPLPKPLGVTLLKGNVALSSHGETQPEEPLGNGDATRAFQQFRLGRAPLTYIPSATDLAGKAELEIRINREFWQRVDSLYARKPTERVYTARQNDAGETVITFGDGRTGARVPTGALNVVARYRKGLGLAGRVKSDQLSLLLERPVGLRAVTNPLPADGGADPETRDDARAAAPTTVRTFGRAVSLKDFEWIGTSSGLVARAYASWVWEKLEKAVHLTVAAAGGTPLSAESLATLHAAIGAARDPNHTLLLANVVRVPITVHARLLGDPSFVADDVADAARAALLDHFAFEAMPLGRAVHASDVFAVLQGASGVVAVDLELFHLKDHADLSADEREVRAVTTAAVQSHIRIYPARPTPDDPALIDRYAKAAFEGGVAPPVLPAEQAYIADPAADVALTVVEAL